MSDYLQATASLDRIKKTIPPPDKPIDAAAVPLPEDVPTLPDDLFAFINTYGSGSFENGGLFLSVLNPYEKNYWTKVNNELESIRSYKASEGDKYVPYKIYPDQPGLLLWGYGEQRKHFFWLTDGKPESWPVIVLYDLEIDTKFNMSMIHFLEKLVCGDLDCDFIGGVDTPNNHITTSYLRFTNGDREQ